MMLSSIRGPSSISSGRNASLERCNHCISSKFFVRRRFEVTQVHAHGTIASMQQVHSLHMSSRHHLAARATPDSAPSAAAAAPAPTPGQGMPPTTPAPAAADLKTLSAQCDIRVGKIIKCERHPDADSLYVEQIDVGETEPRTIVSGLVKYVPLEQMQDRLVIVICNLKERNMRGIKSKGMVLCASDAGHEVVEPLQPPAGAQPGERCWFGQGNQSQAAPAEPNRMQKKKIWEAVQPALTTDASRTACLQDLPMLTSVGPVATATLVGARIA